MLISKDYEYNDDIEISNDEYEVICKFLELYKDQNVIIADDFYQSFNIMLLEEKKINFKRDEDLMKLLTFYRRIYHKEEIYAIKLVLYRTKATSYSPNCLGIQEFCIFNITNRKEHLINLDVQDPIKSNILFNIISIFDERKIISPEKAYCNRMFTSKILQEFITNHEWKKISEGIKQTPLLANELFIIREGYENGIKYTADFGTILYQLISFRQHNLDNFDENDLDELDNLISMLRETELLKVQLSEEIKHGIFPVNSILLESDEFDVRNHSSVQYNIDNTELTGEHKVLKYIIKNCKEKDKNSQK